MNHKEFPTGICGWCRNRIPGCGCTQEENERERIGLPPMEEIKLSGAILGKMKVRKAKR